MDWKDEVRPTLAWADGYEEAEDYEDDRRDEDDETIQSLTKAHELWRAMLQSWVKAEAESNVKIRLLMVLPKPFKDLHGRRDVGACRHGLEACFHIKRGQSLDTDFGNQLIDANAARLGSIFQTICQVVRQANGKGVHVSSSKHSVGVSTFKSGHKSCTRLKSFLLYVTMASALPATASSIR